MSNNLESLIRQYVLLGPISAKGFEVIKCAVCNDYQTRGGFKFDGDSVFYSCFNCQCKAGYNVEKNKHSITKKFKDVLIAFGIPESDIIKTVSFNFFKDKKEEVIKLETKQSGLEFPLTEINLPSNSIKIDSNDSIWCEIAEQYLTNRSLKISDFSTVPYITETSSYIGRILIPYVFRDKIIYWQGRAMDESITPRYKNPSIEKNNIFYNMDEIYRYTTEPLFVTEGPLDAVSIGKNAVAILGSTLSEFKLKELSKIADRRKIIFVIDKNQNGFKLGREILNIDIFYISTFPDNIEDSNDALQKFGRIWMINQLLNNAVKGFKSQLLLKLKCK